MNNAAPQDNKDSLLQALLVDENTALQKSISTASNAAPTTTVIEQIDAVVAAGPVFKDLILDGLDFSGRAIIGAKFERCSLRHCNFRDCDLSYVRFVECDLYCLDLEGAMLYACWFTSCDLTKANFANSFMSGMRMSTVDITHADFGDKFRLGRNRKSVVKNQMVTRSSPLAFGSPIPSVRSVEKLHDSIAVDKFYLAVVFRDDPPAEAWRAWRRKSEICKILKRVHLENGYLEKATRYYYLERLFRRYAMPKGPARFFDWLIGDCLWGYGVGYHKAIFSLLISVVAFAVIYLLLPIVIPGSGVALQSGYLVHLSLQMTITEFLYNIGYALYYSALNAASIYTFGDVAPVGWGKLFALIQVISSVLIVALLIASLAKRVANI